MLIAAPSPLHLALVACAAHGLPILCEKPCGTTAAEARAAAAAADAAGCVLQIGYWRRFAPGLRALRERIRAGELGELTLVSCYQWDAEPPAPEFRATSGGVAVDMGVHELDQLRWLTGRSSAVRRHRAGAGGAGPEGLQLLGSLSGGTAAFVSLGQRFPHGDCVWVEVFGTAGYALERGALGRRRRRGVPRWRCGPRRGPSPSVSAPARPATRRPRTTR